MKDWITAASLAAATLASEDLAAVSAATLAAGGHVNIYVATGAVTAGIYAGDLLLFVCGRASTRVSVLRRWIAGRWSGEQLRELTRTLDQRLALAILASRFVPGTRLPLYVAAGVFSRRPAAFCAWTFVAVAVWTPLLVSGVLLVGQAFESPARWYLTWTPLAAVLMIWHIARRALAARRTR
jgi:membrane protein DedA with SNARE-associated domain